MVPVAIVQRIAQKGRGGMEYLRRIVFLAAATAAALAAGAGAAGAAPVQWSANGHYYEILVLGAGEYGWRAAEQAANSYTGMGLQWHLATLTSREENDWFYNTLVKALKPAGPVWLGGFQDGGARSPSAGWKWVTGEEWGYANWWDGIRLIREPNDLDRRENHQEDYLAFFYPFYGNGWNDVRGDSKLIRLYAIESVPIPGAAWLLGAGLAGLVLLRRKKALR